MNTINTYYLKGQLALAAYADLLEGTPGIGLLAEAGFGATQAAAFSAQYEVVDRYDGMVLHNYIDEFGNPQQAMTPTGSSKGTGVEFFSQKAACIDLN